MSDPVNPKAKEAEWYDDYYQCVQAMGPWCYYMLPDLSAEIGSDSQLVEFGCGQAHAFRYLVEKGLIRQDQLHAIDQSRTAVDFVRTKLPNADIQVGDIYKLQFQDKQFDVALLMETIEHLEHPETGLAEIRRTLKPNGLLYVSFPNFLSLPWLAVRLLSDLLNKPNWVVRQPIDKIYTVFSVVRLLKRNGFRLERGIGSGYGPPLLYLYEKEWMTRALNRLGLWRIAFHPILVFRRLP